MKIAGKCTSRDRTGRIGVSYNSSGAPDVANYVVIQKLPSDPMDYFCWIYEFTAIYDADIYTVLFHNFVDHTHHVLRATGKRKVQTKIAQDTSLKMQTNLRIVLATSFHNV